MQILAIGLWGCFFGSCLLVLSGAAFAFTRSMYRVGINASLSAIGPAFVAIAFLVAIPIENRDVLLRFLAHLTAVVGALLVYQLLNVLGSLRTASRRKRAKVFFCRGGCHCVGSELVVIAC